MTTGLIRVGPKSTYESYDNCPKVILANDNWPKVKMSNDNWPKSSNMQSLCFGVSMLLQ